MVLILNKVIIFFTNIIRISGDRQNAHRYNAKKAADKQAGNKSYHNIVPFIYCARSQTTS